MRWLRLEEHSTGWNEEAGQAEETIGSSGEERQNEARYVFYRPSEKF